MAHPDLESEQRHLDHAYRCLAAMRERTEATVAIDDMAAQAVDGEIARWHLQQRLRALDVDVPGLAFGRIDEEGSPKSPGPTWYVGRRHVEDERGEPVVVDWRAGVSTPFYRATASDPFGLHMRRRFMMTNRHVDDLFDEVFDDPDSVHAARHGGIPDPLLAELERERTGEMRDIVATIQAEQDVVIRAPLESCLVVQGGPGTGKTAVGLHRAAFLLYEHRQLLDEETVLVIGPNPVFLRYISQVLPSLGETAVRQSTVERLLGGRVRAFDPPEVATIKGDARMAAVLVRAAAATVKPPQGDLDVSTNWGRVRLSRREIVDAIDEIRERDVPHNVGRNALRTQLVRMAQQDISDRRGEDTAPLGFADELRTNKQFQSALAAWPAVSPPALVRRLLSSPTALRTAAQDVLAPSEQALLLRKATKRADDEPWTAADLVLVDEAEAIADGVRRTYGHIVVDEAQDLTAMELRALARRCPRHSMTVLGDLAQATRPGAQRSWDDVLVHLGSPEGADFTELDLGYRVPAPIIEYANHLLPEAAPDVRPTRSVRESGPRPNVVEVGADEDMSLVVQRVVDELGARWTSVGVVVPDDAGVTLSPISDGVTVVAPPEAKGLEFDAVVVVEPAKFVPATGDEHRAGLRLLYVALTRAVQILTIVHREPLPPALVAASPPGASHA
jgi:DNA helicase IV